MRISICSMNRCSRPSYGSIDTPSRLRRAGNSAFNLPFKRLPGVHIGEGARIRRAIIEEGVQIPAEFHVGWDIEQDRMRHTVSPSGVVVVSGAPKIAKPTVTHSVQEKTVIGFKPAAHRQPARN